MRNKFYFTVILLFSITCLNAQVWHSNFAGPDTTLSCGTTCINYVTKVPEIRTTERYVVAAAPYTPYPFTTAAPALTLSCSNQDDKFFDASSLGFNFCFYGRTFTDLVVGTNCLVTFDITNALGCNHWSLGTASPIPFTGTGAQCFTSCPTPSGVMYPRATIFGAYHDIYIDGPSANKKMEFRVEGSAPARRAIVSFNEIPLFSCTNSLATHQIVIYEATGIIEIYLKDKPICNSFNSGRALVGIQNWERNDALAPPGRNLGQWGTNNMNEAWRFTPDGATTLLDRAELLLNNTVVATGTLGTSANGTVAVDFGNICPPANNNDYVIKAYYRTCDNDNTIFSVTDTVKINKTQTLNITGSVLNASCLPNATGTITITNPVGPTYQYSIDNGVTFQASPVFIKVPGSYDILIKDLTTLCTSTQSFVINSNTTLTATATTTGTNCPGSPTGTITVNASLGSPGYTYSMAGDPFGSSNVFTGLPDGSYVVSVKDNAQCIFNFNVTVNAGNGFSATATKVDASCAGSATGSITVTPDAQAVAPITYTLNGGTPQSSPTFNGLLGGSTYAIVVTDGNGCTFNLGVRVNNGAGITGTANITSASCAGSPSGAATIVPSAAAVAPITFSIDGGTPQSGATFTGLIGGNSYNFTIKDGNNCTVTIPVTITSGTGISATSTTLSAACSGSASGSLTIAPSANAVAPITFSLNAGTP
ncbi:MAG: SprB repeat-containing protein, partial [Ferruginibacter sp.]